MLKKLYTRAEVEFELIKEIGHEGGNSQVHLAKDQHLDAEMVIKRVLKSAIVDANEYFSEARILYLSSHPNVVPVYYACEDADAIYLAMPFYKAGSLKAQIAKKFLTTREIVRYACQFLSGLHNIHSKKLVHFDVKPDNILLSDSDEARISDFGLTKRTDFTGRAGQDRWYDKMRPPESYSGDHFDRRFDIYQVGLTLYRMANGDVEFYDQLNVYGDAKDFDRSQFKYDVVNGRFPDRKRYLHHIPRRLRTVISNCLNPDPSQRYASVIDVINDLSDIDGNELDWRFSKTSTGDRTWVKDTAGDGSVHTLNISVSGAALAHKSVNGGEPRRVLAYCKSSLTNGEIQKFFRSE